MRRVTVWVVIAVAIESRLNFWLNFRENSCGGWKVLVNLLT